MYIELEFYLYINCLFMCIILDLINNLFWKIFRKYLYLKFFRYCILGVINLFVFVY